jgi:hypothetical protein
MSESKNALPVRTYVRSRASTIVVDVAELASGSVELSLAEASDVTVILVSDPMEGTPMFLAAAVGRAPTLSDFDIILAPLDPEEVKPPGRVTLHLPAMESALYWASFGVDGTSQAFGDGSLSRLVVAIDA